MSRRAARGLAIVGGAFLAGSIFLPRPGIGSLAGELGSWWEALVLTVEAPEAPFREVVPLLGVVMTLLYVPLSGVAAILTGLAPARAGRSRIVAGAMAALHSIFLCMLAILGVGGIATRDQWLPAPAYWALAALAIVGLLAVWALAWRLPAARRLGGVSVPTLLFFALVFAGVGTWLLLQDQHAWNPMGPLASGAGALLAFIGVWTTRYPEP